MSGGLLAVLPVIAQETADVCIPSILRAGSAAGLKPDELLVVDNSREGWAADRYGLTTHRDPNGRNLGTSRAWNLGVREVLDRDLDYLLIMSASIQFGPLMHTSWRRQMETFWGERVIEATGHSFHLIAIHRSCFEKVGGFDPAYYPGYFEAVDWARKMHVVGWEHDWTSCWVNAMSTGVAQAVAQTGIQCPAGPLLEHYAARWGGAKGSETFTVPYGNKPLDYCVEEPIPVLAERYGLGEYGVGWW